MTVPAMSVPVPPERAIVFDDVSKFYGEVLGVNRVTLSLAPGITGLVGPNGAGKSTLMNLMTGLLRPTQGRVTVLGVPTDDPARLFRLVGYCTQVDAFPRGATGFGFIYAYLRVHGHRHADAEELAWQALDRVGLRPAARRKVAGYSKGMRQRVRLAQAIAHDPQVLVLDEPLNGLDPMARAEVIDVFQQFAAGGRHLVISSHILHEVDMISDQVVLLTAGYVVAEGEIHDVRSQMASRPTQVLVRCAEPGAVAARLFAEGVVEEVTLHEDRGGFLARSREPQRFYLLLNDVVVERRLRVDTVTVADADVRAVYQYLIGAHAEGEGP